MRFRNIPIRNIISEAMNTGGIIIDVRTKAEFDSGHIPLALNVPLDTIKSKNYRLPKSKTLLVYCMHGGSSAVAAKRLFDDGYDVVNAVGGLKQYRGALSRS